MLRTLFTRSLLLTVALLAGPAFACTAADAGPTTSAPLDSVEGGVVHMTPAARMSPTVGLGNAEGLKLRMRQHDTLLSAYMQPGQTHPALRADAEPSRSTDRTNATLAPRAPVLTPSEASDDSHAYKPVAMLVAALAVMVSIALRRGGKR